MTITSCLLYFEQQPSFHHSFPSNTPWGVLLSSGDDDIAEKLSEKFYRYFICHASEERRGEEEAGGSNMVTNFPMGGGRE